jgi:guanylate kinase
MKKKLVIVGRSGSGKDYLLKKLIEKGLKYSPKITTRPIRNGETNGVEYLFMKNNIVYLMLRLNQHKTIETFEINDVKWIYIITSKNFEDNELFIMTPGELKQLNKEDRDSCYVVYLNIDENICRKRLNNRNDNADSVDRRINSDNNDFENFSDYDLLITEPNFDCDKIYADFTTK